MFVVLIKNPALKNSIVFFHYHLVPLSPTHALQSPHCCPCPWVLSPFCSVPSPPDPTTAVALLSIYESAPILKNQALLNIQQLLHKWPLLYYCKKRHLIFQEAREKKYIHCRPNVPSGRSFPSPWPFFQILLHYQLYSLGGFSEKNKKKRQAPIAHSAPLNLKSGSEPCCTGGVLTVGQSSLRHTQLSQANLS